jgi:hypothetical protein
MTAVYLRCEPAKDVKMTTSGRKVGRDTAIRGVGDSAEWEGRRVSTCSSYHCLSYQGSHLGLALPRDSRFAARL